MRVPSMQWMLLCALLTACTTPSAFRNEEVQAPEVVSSWEEGCEDERSLVLLCREDSDECGFFLCRDVAPREVLLASRGGGPIYIPMGSPASRRWRGRPFSWPRNTEPILTFRFNRHFDPKPPVPALPPGRYVRHHLFSQAADLREWFLERGIPDIHRYTMVLHESVHLYIHGGGASGGRWNEAWRQFKIAKPRATPEEIYRHAGELIFRFELTGPIVPYYRRK